MLKLVKAEKIMRKSNYTQEFKDSTIKFCIDNSDKSIFLGSVQNSVSALDNS